MLTTKSLDSICSHYVHMFWAFTCYEEWPEAKYTFKSGLQWLIHSKFTQSFCNVKKKSLYEKYSLSVAKGTSNVVFKLCTKIGLADVIIGVIFLSRSKYDWFCNFHVCGGNFCIITPFSFIWYFLMQNKIFKISKLKGWRNINKNIDIDLSLLFSFSSPSGDFSFYI